MEKRLSAVAHAAKYRTETEQNKNML